MGLALSGAYIYIRMIVSSNGFLLVWVSVNSISKFFDNLIRDLGFNLRLHKKLIGVLVW